MRKATIYWITHDQESIEKIMNRFGMTRYMSVNRETPCAIKDEDWELLEETARRRFIQIRIKKDEEKM